MRHEVFLAVVLLCGTMLSFLAANRRHRWIHYALMIGFAGFWFLVPIVAFRTASEQSSPLKMPETPRNRPVEEHSQGYVGSNRCLSCHPHEHASWHASYHRTMTQLATPKTVTGDFNGVIEWRGKQVELWREHNTFLVDIEMPAGAQALGEALRFQRPIVMTTGSHNMQAYWYPLMEDSPFLGMLPFVYLHEEQQWIPRTTAFLQPDRAEPDETGRWSND